MGNAAGKLTPSCLCPAGAGDISRRHDIAAIVNNHYPFLDNDGGLGHSFCYIRPDQFGPISKSLQTAPFFQTISGASISANTATPLSTSLLLPDPDPAHPVRSASFESSPSFASVPLQPIPRTSAVKSGPLPARTTLGSGPIERGFMSGPIERGFVSLEEKDNYHNPQLSKWRSMKSIKSTIAGAISNWGKEKSINESNDSIINFSSNLSIENEDPCCSSMEVQNLQWAQGKAGEDRVQIVVSEDHGWVFVGIYDGFNGPDAPDFLLSNLYPAVHKELIDEDFDNSLRRNSGVDCSSSAQEGEPIKEKLNRMGWTGSSGVRHEEVMKAMSEALRKTEEEYLDVADRMVEQNPELALMGSCVMVMLMMGQDIYLMNVGDSRAVLAQYPIDSCFNDDELSDVCSLQLTLDHNTSIKEEVERIRSEHPGDAYAMMNDRVKGSLKVTRAFGAGFLKQPKWNDALLEMFRIDYVGSSPYITCCPSLAHHKIGSRDKFLILSSDGLYQYFTNQEVVSQVELFMSSSPEGDPAQHLIEEVLFRAAKKAGMDFHELLEIPQGERRRYHDDVSVIVISLEGRIWRSSV